MVSVIVAEHTSYFSVAGDSHLFDDELYEPVGQLIIELVIHFFSTVLYVPEEQTGLA